MPDQSDVCLGCESELIITKSRVCSFNMMNFYSAWVCSTGKRVKNSSAQLQVLTEGSVMCLLEQHLSDTM